MPASVRITCSSVKLACVRPMTPTRCPASSYRLLVFFFFQAEDGIRDIGVTGVQTCALPICNETIVEIAAGIAQVFIGGLEQGVQPGIELDGPVHGNGLDKGHKRLVACGVGGDRKSVV